MGAAAEEVDRDDRLRARADRGDGGADVEVERARVDVDEDGARARSRDRAGAREEREGGGHDLVPAPDSRGEEGEDERVASGCHADRVRGAEACGERFFEEAHLVAQNERLRRNDAIDCGAHLRFDRSVLELQIEEGDRASGGAGGSGGGAGGTGRRMRHRFNRKRRRRQLRP